MDLDPKTWWYVSRATGFVSWALLAIAVLWGLFLTNKTLAKSTAPAWVLDLHRHLGGLAVVFVGVHIAVLPLDTYTDWGWRDLFLPMASRWHPLAVAFGIVGLYLLLAVEITSLLQKRMPRAWWRRVHMLSFPLYVIASVHLFAAGTDAGSPVVMWSVVVVSTLVAFLSGVRGLAVASPRPERSPRVPAAARARASESADGSAAPAGRERVAARVPDRARADAPEPVPEPAAVATTGEPERMRPPTAEERATRIRERAHAAAIRSQGTAGRAFVEG